MSTVTIEAPAKLNVHLEVGGRRPDGFHDIESLFVALAWGDTLRLETVPAKTGAPPDFRPEIAMNLAIPPEQNIITRAISLFKDRTGFNHGVKVAVEKRIPLGGGLGGGSSDAAAALLALNHLAAADGVSGAELAEMGAALGSDVPFFLYGAPAAWVTGRGERIQPLELPDSVRGLPVVLVNPGFASDTAEAYRLLDFVREETRTEDTEVHGAHGENTRDFRTTTPCPSCPPCLREMSFFNDFLPVLAASEKGTVYERIITELNELGAAFAGLSGSGSTCFGVFLERNRAESAQKVLLKRWPFVILTFFSCVSGNTVLQL